MTTLSQFSAQLARWMMLSIVLCFILPPSFSQSQGGPFFEWNTLYPKIRDRLISKEEAQRQLKALELSIRETSSQRFMNNQEDRLCFPLKGYTFHSIGGTKGSGYRVQGYDFFDGNQHKGHPGHDIFIQDRDQDGVDDRTGYPVQVLSVDSGVVVSVHDGWEPLSPVRGGNYVWVYHPVKDLYFYYAHLGEIAVSVGQVVSRGGLLGTVGRTGLNAYPKRSPTHLHFSVHHSVDGIPRAINPYLDLVKAEVR